MKAKLLTHISLSCVLSAALLSSLTGCGQKEGAATTGPFKAAVQTDWYAQAEHGGFYQAAAEGLYKENGLDIEIRQGGPGTHMTTSLATGRVEFAIGRSDDVIMSIAQGLPLVIVGALMQQDPQALLLHEENPVSDFKDLDGKTIMTTPGAVYVQHLQAHYGIKINIMPLNYGLAQFMSDKNFIQQCFATNEPFYVRQSGGKPKILLLSKSGYEPYRVIVTSRKFANENPDIVRKFLAATFKGWAEYMGGDNTAANELILKSNQNMTKELLTFAVAEMNKIKLIGGDPARGEHIGLITRKRLQDQLNTLDSLKILPGPLTVDQVARFDLLPADLQAMVGE